jgi:hypothetical protein
VVTIVHRVMQQQIRATHPSSCHAPLLLPRTPCPVTHPLSCHATRRRGARRESGGVTGARALLAPAPRRRSSPGVLPRKPGCGGRAVAGSGLPASPAFRSRAQWVRCRARPRRRGWPGWVQATNIVAGLTAVPGEDPGLFRTSPSRPGATRLAVVPFPTLRNGFDQRAGDMSCTSAAGVPVPAIMGVGTPRAGPVVTGRGWIGTTARCARTRPARSRPERAWVRAGDGRPPGPDIR